MLRESIFFQDEFKIVPVFSPAMFKVVEACNDFENDLLPDSLVFNAFYGIKSKYLNNLSYDKLLEIRKEGHFENVRTFIRDEYRNVLTLSGKDSKNYGHLINQFRNSLEDCFHSTEKEWEKIRKQLSREYKADVINQSIILFGSVLGLGASTYFNNAIIEAIMAIVGTTNLKDLITTIVEERPNKLLKEKHDELINQNPLFVYFSSND